MEEIVKLEGEWLALLVSMRVGVHGVHYCPAAILTVLALQPLPVQTVHQPWSETGKLRFREAQVSPAGLPEVDPPLLGIYWIC